MRPHEEADSHGQTAVSLIETPPIAVFFYFHKVGKAPQSRSAVPEAFLAGRPPMRLKKNIPPNTRKQLFRALRIRV
jgi:hypothetical protein